MISYCLDEIPCCKENNIISCKSVHVLPAYLGKSIVHLPNEIKVFFLNKIPASTLSYHYANHGIDAIFNYNPATKKLNGQVRKSNGQLYNLENCGKEVHVWKEINTTFTQDKYTDKKNDYIMLPTLNNDYTRDTPEDNTTMTFISVKFYYTPSALSFINDMDGFVEQLISSANQGFINSRVPITIQKHCVEPSTIDDIHDSNEMLTKFKEMKSSINELKGSADATTLIVNDMDACGNSYFNGIDSGLTLSVIIKSCALLEYSLAHELGHNMGLQHDLTPNKKYLYGHGHLIKSGNGNPGSRTIMAYFSKGHKIRKNVFSNPSVLNAETGTRIGIEGKSNSAAVLLRNRMRMSLLGDESEKCLKGKIHESTVFAPNSTVSPNVTLTRKFINSENDPAKKKNTSIPISLPRPVFKDVLDKKNNTSKSPLLPFPKIKDVLDKKKNASIPTPFVGKKNSSITTSMPLPKLKDEKNTLISPPKPLPTFKDVFMKKKNSSIATSMPVPKSKDIIDKKAVTSKPSSLPLTKLKNEFSGKKNSFSTTSLPLTKSMGILDKRTNDSIPTPITLPLPKLKDDIGNKKNTSLSTLSFLNVKDGLVKKKNISNPIMTSPLPKVKNELGRKTNNSKRTTLSLPKSKKDIGNNKNTSLLTLPISNIKDGLGNQKNTKTSVAVTKINLVMNRNTSKTTTTLSPPKLKPLNSSATGLPKFDPSVFKLNRHSK